MGVPHQQGNKTKLTVTTYHFNKGKEHASQDTEANKMEAKQHDLVFDADADDDNSVIETRNHEVAPPQTNDTDTRRRLYEVKGIDFKQILQAQKANTRIHTGDHEFDPNEESDEDEEHTGLEVNSHWFKGCVDDKEKEEEEVLNDGLHDIIDGFGATHNSSGGTALQRTTASSSNATTS